MPSLFIHIPLSLQLTPATLGCLHQLISYLGEASDYQNAMLFYSSMVSGPSFSEIAAFAPTIKILIQQSIQLQIVWWSSDINKYSQYNTAMWDRHTLMIFRISSSKKKRSFYLIDVLILKRVFVLRGYSVSYENVFIHFLVIWFSR